jgi:hypothetical protein
LPSRRAGPTAPSGARDDLGGAHGPDPDLPTQGLIGNFTASLGDGATFPHLNGTVGDPTGVDDPTDGELLPAMLVASGAAEDTSRHSSQGPPFSGPCAYSD